VASRKNSLEVPGELKKLRKKIPIISLSGYAELPAEAFGAADEWCFLSCRSVVRRSESLVEVGSRSR